MGKYKRVLVKKAEDIPERGFPHVEIQDTMNWRVNKWRNIGNRLLKTGEQPSKSGNGTKLTEYDTMSEEKVSENRIRFKMNIKSDDGGIMKYGPAKDEEENVKEKIAELVRSKKSTNISDYGVEYESGAFKDECIECGSVDTYRTDGVFKCYKCGYKVLISILELMGHELNETRSTKPLPVRVEKKTSGPAKILTLDDVKVRIDERKEERTLLDIVKEKKEAERLRVFKWPFETKKIVYDDAGHYVEWCCGGPLSAENTGGKGSLVALGVMPDNFSDLCLTDPPYGIGETAEKNLSRGSDKIKARDYGHYEWDMERVDLEFFKQMQRVAKEQIIFGGNYYTDVLGPTSSWVVWDKGNHGSDQADCELAWTSHGAAVRYFRVMWSGMIREGRENRWHPTQKPLSLFKQILKHRSYKKGVELVIDPFLGSGTTLRAAMACGMSAIGFDMSGEYEQEMEESLRTGEKKLFRF